MKRAKWQRPAPCWCSGYWFPHRKGSGCCESAPVPQAVRVQLRRGTITQEQALDILAEHAFTTPGTPATGEEPPF